MVPDFQFPPVFVHHGATWHHAKQTYCGSATADTACGERLNGDIVLAINWPMNDARSEISDWCLREGHIEWSRSPMCGACLSEGER